MVFSTNFISGYGNVSDTEYLKPFIERGSHFRNKVGKDEIYAPEITSIMAEISREWQEQKAGYRLMIKADVLRVLTILIRHYLSGNERMGSLSEEKSKALRRLENAFHYIDTHYCGKVTLQDAARCVYMSPNYFSSFFHMATDIRFSDYVTIRRIRKARQLLETTDMGIYEIALSCGFSNSSNFYRLYKKHTGQSPRSRRD